MLKTVGDQRTQPLGQMLPFGRAQIVEGGGRGDMIVTKNTCQIMLKEWHQHEQHHYQQRNL